jgi:hypothetical protein
MLKKQKLTTEQYLGKVTLKLQQMVGKPEFDPASGKSGFIAKSWESHDDRSQFITWLSSELQRDKDFYAALNRFGHRNNTKRNCDQMAEMFDCNYGPKNTVCEKQ